MCGGHPTIILIEEHSFIVLTCDKYIAISNHQKIRISKSKSDVRGQVKYTYFSCNITLIHKYIEGGRSREETGRKRERDLARNSAPCLTLESPNMTCEFCKEPPWTVPMEGLCRRKVTIVLIVERCGVLG